MKPSHRKYVKETRRGRVEKTLPKMKSSKPKRNTKLMVAENVGAKGEGRY